MLMIITIWIEGTDKEDISAKLEHEINIIMVYRKCFAAQWRQMQNYDH